MHGGLLRVVTAMFLLAPVSAPAFAQSAYPDVDARAAAERTLDRSRRLMRIGIVGAGMSVAAMLMSDARRTGRGVNALAVGGVTALGLGIVGLIKTRRAERRLEAFDERSQASHQVGLAPLPDGVAANYSVAW